MVRRTDHLHRQGFDLVASQNTHATTIAGIQIHFGLQLLGLLGAFGLDHLDCIRKGYKLQKRLLNLRWLSKEEPFKTNRPP